MDTARGGGVLLAAGAGGAGHPGRAGPGGRVPRRPRRLQRSLSSRRDGGSRRPPGVGAGVAGVLGGWKSMAIATRQTCVVVHGFCSRTKTASYYSRVGGIIMLMPEWGHQYDGGPRIIEVGPMSDSDFDFFLACFPSLQSPRGNFRVRCRIWVRVRIWVWVRNLAHS